MTSLSPDHPSRILADLSDQFGRCSARLALEALELERIAEGRLAVSPVHLANLADARARIDEVLDRAPVPAVAADTGTKGSGRVRLAEPKHRLKKSI
jgi:hypothetical protein